MFKLRIVLLASGSGTLAQAIFDAKLNMEILALISDKDSEALKRAERAGVEAIYLPVAGSRDEWNTKLLSVVEELNPDLVVSVGFMRILGRDFVEKFRTVNTHPALLPNFPGAHAVADALSAKVKETGATVHWVDEGVDTGAVIVQQSVAVEPSDTEESLHERIKIKERELIVETLQKFIDSGAK
jgi:phosphoribosylglycinamide formyltransferase-1